MLFHHASDQPTRDLTSRLADAIHPWVYDASRPYSDWYFGDEEAAQVMIGRFLRRPSSEVYAGRALLMCDEEHRPMGCVLGCSGAELAACRAADFAALCEAVGEHPEADELLSQTIDVARRLFPPVEDDEFYLSRIALAPHARGRGLGRALVGRAIEAQRKRGFTRFRLDVSADHGAAIRVYESLGLRIVSHSRCPEAGLEYCAMTLAL